MQNNETNSIDWISPCPVKNCKNKNKYYRWTHQGCGGNLRLNIQGQFICTKCNSTKRYRDWLFQCGAHKPEETSSQGVSEALDNLSKLIVRKSKEKIILPIIRAVLNQFPELQNESKVKEIAFTTICPIQECLTSDTKYKWKHPKGPNEKCSGQLKLTIEGYIKCSKCSINTDILMWDFECNKHQGKQKPSAQGLCMCFSKLSMNDQSLKAFVTKLSYDVMGRGQQ